MRRVVVVGAGLFGVILATRLLHLGVPTLVVTRLRKGDRGERMDAEDEASIRRVLRAGDVVVDVAGPYAKRTTLLARTAIVLGCDTIDLSENLAWSEAIIALGARAVAGGVRLYPACSAIAAVVGACVVASRASPESIDIFLAPASADTAVSAASRQGFASSLGLPIRTYRGGTLATVRGYAEQRAFPSGARTGGIVEHAGAVLLPLSWPGLRRTELWVDPNVLVGRGTLAAATRIPMLAAMVRAATSAFAPTLLGRHDGVFAVDIRDPNRRDLYVFTAPRYSYLVAVEPAVMAAEALARGAAPRPGVVLPHEQVDPELLFARLRSFEITLVTRSGLALKN